MAEIILASQSPRRKKLLGEMSVVFETIPSNYDEQLDESRDMEDVAEELSLGKALDVARLHPDAYVIGSDTIVGVKGKQLEKPVDIEKAREMLILQAENESAVSSGVAIVNINAGVQLVDVDTTQVVFKSDSPDVVQAREEYLASEDWKDKAGGYGIQSGAGVLIERIDGDYDTIVGLPTRVLARMLNELGIEAKQVVEQEGLSSQLRSTSTSGSHKAYAKELLLLRGFIYFDIL